MGAPAITQRVLWRMGSTERAAICNLGVADWHGREAIRANLKAFIDTGFTALHEVKAYWDGGDLKVFRGTVTMTPDDGGASVHPTMTHFFYMDERDPPR